MGHTANTGRPPVSPVNSLLTIRDDAYGKKPRGYATDIYAAALEFCGTVLFLLLGLGGVQSAVNSARMQSETINSSPTADQLVYSSVSMGLALLVSAWLFYRVTGGLFNPNVSLSLLLVGAINPLRFVLYCIAQIAGAIVAAGLLQALLPGELEVNTVPGANTTKVQALFIEMFITAALCFAVLMLAAEKHRVTAFAPIGIGLTLLVGELWAIQYTGGAMNTARAFGPAVVTNFDRSHWVYWLGPFLGSLLATFFYKALKFLKYERLNPNQDIEIEHKGDSHLPLPVTSATSPPASSANGINALRVSAQMALVNGVPMMVANVPFLGLPNPFGGGGAAGSEIPATTNLTLVFDQGTATHHVSGMQKPPAVIQEEPFTPHDQLPPSHLQYNKEHRASVSTGSTF